MGTNDSLVGSMIESGVLKTPQIMDAFFEIDRADFVLPKYKDDPYGDYPLPIGGGGTISQPSTVAFMLEILQPGHGDKILDVGSGSGWTTALMTHIVGSKGKVLGVEIVPELVEFGQKNLARYYPSVSLLNKKRQGVVAEVVLAKEGELGLPDKAPFDKILVSAAAEELPDELIDQLKVGGRLVIPIGNSVWQIDKIVKHEIKKKEFPGFAFIPLVR